MVTGSWKLLVVASHSVVFFAYEDVRCGISGAQAASLLKLDMIMLIMGEIFWSKK